jgi:glycosyltransferase involved in cell wall biosynthesis
MRAAVFADQLLYKIPGGIATYLRCLAPELLRQGGGDEFVFFHCGRKGDDLEGLPGGSLRMRVPGGRVLLGISWNYLRRPRVEGCLGRLDILHATQLVVPAGRAPLVATVHDLFVMRYPGSFPPRWRRLLLRGLEVTLKEARLLLANSRATADDLASVLRQGDDRVRVVPLGVEEPPSSPPGAVEEARRRHGLPESYLIHVGTREPRKNLQRLLDAYRLGRDGGWIPRETGLALVGPAGWGTEEAERQAATQPGVSMVGFVPAGELDLLLKGAVALVYPSLDEGFGLPVLEAMARGIPVVTSDTSATREVAEGAALLVDPCDVCALAEAMAEICTDVRRREELGRLGLERASGYRWEETARLTLQAYREAAA